MATQLGRKNQFWWPFSVYSEGRVCCSLIAVTIPGHWEFNFLDRHVLLHLRLLQFEARDSIHLFGHDPYCRDSSMETCCQVV